MNEVEQAIKSHWEKWLFDLKEMIEDTIKNANAALEATKPMVEELQQILTWLNEEIASIVEDRRI